MKAKGKTGRRILYGGIAATFILLLVLVIANRSGETVSGRFSDISSEAVPPLAHFDPAEFYAMSEKAPILAAAGQQEKSFALYEEMLSLLDELRTQKTLHLVAYSENVNDPAMKEENEYATALYSDLYNQMLETGSLFARAFGESFREYLGNDWLYDRYSDYGSVPDGVTDLNRRIAELVSDYHSVISGKDSIPFRYDGKDYSLNDLSNSSLRKALGEDALKEITLGCRKAINAAAGKIFLELVQLRTELAALYGYDSYAAYADEQKYFRDYGEAELQQFYASVKSVAYRYQPISDASEFLPYSGESIDDTAWLASRLVKKLPAAEQDSFQKLMNDGLLISGSGEGYASGGFTDALPSVDSAIIYMRYYGSNDITTLMHELGHFTDFIVNGYDPMDRQIIDVSEIHSTGTGALLLDCFDGVFTKEQSERLKAYELSELLSCVVFGCIFDEWQRMVYADPDMTLDEVNAAYRQVCLSYGRQETDQMEYEWVNVHHSYDNPLYYISYSTSAVVSMQIYHLSRTDRQTALDAWSYFLDCGSVTPYLEAVSGSGLLPFTAGDDIAALFSDCADAVDAITAKYQK